MSKTRKLGKGLEALFGESSRDKEAEMISVSVIVPNEWQPRREFEEKALQGLADSIKEHGVVQPVIVRPKEGTFELIAGERRLRAAQLAGLSEIPALVRDYTDQETAEIALIENLQREDLNPLEEGLAYKRMIGEYRFTQEKMAELVGKSRSYVTNMIRLLDLCDEVKNMVIERKITAGQARPLLGLNNAAEQIALARRIVEEDLSARRVEEILRTGKERKKTRPVNRADAYIRDLEEQLVMAVGAKVRIKVGKGKNSHRGTISIAFKNDGEFERITKLLKQGE
ncbi:MAG: ParB/RepB/Spo0J family partition protein [Dialister sp.]|nr:ParB/RepB/Spo0J family partition protein [Dialister sp.]MDU5889970.1 ParB/RepB/Spo0J family partition protein [Dialister sp.]